MPEYWLFSLFKQAASALQMVTAQALDMQTQKITNVVDPTANQEAATKKYVDDTAASQNELSELTDVTISGLGQHHFLVWSPGLARWVNSLISTAALPTAIDAVNIADGSVSNAEFQRLDGVTSDIQSQFNALDFTQIADADNDTKIEVERTSDDDIIYFKQGGTDRGQIDSGNWKFINNVLITSDITASPDVNEDLHIKTNKGNFTVVRSTSDANSPRAQLFKSRGSVASPTAISSGDGCGNFAFGGYDGSSWLQRSAFKAVASENWSVGNTGLQFTFRVCANGTSALSDAWIMANDTDLNPAADNTSDIGDATHRAKEIFCVTLTQGDVKYTEKKCAICEKPFEVGQKLSVIVITKEKDGTRCVPIHSSCEYSGSIKREVSLSEVRTEPVEKDVERDGKLNHEITHKVKDAYIQKTKEVS